MHLLHCRSELPSSPDLSQKNVQQTMMNQNKDIVLNFTMLFLKQLLFTTYWKLTSLFLLLRTLLAVHLDPGLFAASTAPRNHRQMIELCREGVLVVLSKSIFLQYNYVGAFWRIRGPTSFFGAMTNSYGDFKHSTSSHFTTIISYLGHLRGCQGVKCAISNQVRGKFLINLVACISCHCHKATLTILVPKNVRELIIIIVIVRPSCLDRLLRFINRAIPRSTINFPTFIIVHNDPYWLSNDTK